MPALLCATLLLTAPGAQWLGEPPTSPRRIVSLAPSATELLFAIGAGERVVGVTRFDNRPEAVASLPKVGGFIDPDPEAVLALKPDMVVAIPTSGGRSRIDTIARLGIPVLVLPGEGIDDLWTAIDAIGQATGRAPAAAELAASLRERLDALAQQTRGQAPVRALLVVGQRPLIAAGPGTFLNSMLLRVGGLNVVQRGGAYPQLDLEAVLTLDPDVIIDVNMGGADDGFWQRTPAIRAVATGRVVRIRDDAVLRPGPRLAQGLAALARALRPESK